jgi:hypothetical protein
MASVGKNPFTTRREITMQPPSPDWQLGSCGERLSETRRPSENHGLCARGRRSVPTGENTVNNKLIRTRPYFGLPQLEIKVWLLKQIAEKQTLAGFPYPARRTS